MSNHSKIVIFWQAPSFLCFFFKRENNMLKRLLIYSNSSII